MMMKRKPRQWQKWLLCIVLSPIVLFLLLVLLLYIPPVQNFAVQRLVSSLSSSTGMDVQVDRVRLSFPLDLSVQGVVVRDVQDTVVAARNLHLDVRLLPLFRGRADIDGFGLYEAQVNSKNFISDTYVRGKISKLEVKSHGVEWNSGVVKLDKALLSGAKVYVALSDTARQDTTASAPWDIIVDRADLQDVCVNLSMPGDSMRLSARLGQAVLRGGRFDTGQPYYAVSGVEVKGGTLVYASNAPAGQDEDKRGNAAFFRSDALLWENFKPMTGFDPGCVMVSGLALQADSVSYDRAGTLHAHVRNIAFKERSGLEVTDLSGKVYMDTVRLSIPALELRTAYSRLTAHVDFGFKALEAGHPDVMNIGLVANIGAEDVKTLGWGYLPAGYVKSWPSKPLTAKASVSGNMSYLKFSDTEVVWPGILLLTADGTARNIQSDQRDAAADFSLRIQNAAAVAALFPAEMHGTLGLPQGLRAKGKVAVKGEKYTADVRMGAGRGMLAARGGADLARESYEVAAVSRNFPLGGFLPGRGLGDFSGELKANGRSFDVLSPAAKLDATAEIRHFLYDKFNLGGISVTAKSSGGKAEAHFNALNELVEGEGSLHATLGKKIEGRLTADLPLVNIQQLAQMKDTLHLGTSVDISFFADRAMTAYGAKGGLRYLRFLTPRRGIPAKDLNFDFATSPDTTTALVSAGDLYLNLGSKGDVTGMTGQFGKFAEVMLGQLENKTIDQEALRAAFPEVWLTADVGRDNPLTKILYYKGITFSSARLALAASPQKGLAGGLNIGMLKQGNLQLDTVRFVLYQDTAGIKLDGYTKNYTKKTPQKFEARLNSYLKNTEVGAQILYLDGKGETGIDLGVRAAVADSGLNVSLFPQHPVIAYRNFTVNKDNHIFLGRGKQIRADINLIADDGTALSIHGEPNDSINDITLNLHNLNLGELSNVLPYMPQMSGMLSGDLHVIDDHVQKSLSTAAMFTAAGLTFEGASIGNVGVEAVYLPKAGGEHYANAYVSSNDVEVLQCEGTYFDKDGGSFEGTAQLHDFPLQMLNGFLAETDMAMRGIAGGDLQLSGSLDSPVANGQLDFDSAHLYSDVYGFNFLMDERPIQIENSRMAFRDFSLYSNKSKNPLVVNGVLDLSDFSAITMDFTMRANNFELINAKRNTLSMVFGKVYANYAGNLRGTMDNLSIRGKLDILERTDMTYILKDSPLTVDDRLRDLVQFVDFSDTTTVVSEQLVPPGGFDLTLGISISDAARFRCNLSDDGSNYVNLEGGGDLTMRLTQQGEMRLTGRFTANSGEMKYSLPVIPLKTFNIVQGSSVDFTGDVMNPTLNITAKERVRATVTENEQPRSVTFDVGVAITKPLDNMGLEFIIEAPEDLAVQNQLATMSPDQRSKTAVAMLATGMYMTDDMLTGGGSGFKASNALNAFLQSEIQNIAGSALKTLDISVGMESNTSSTGTTTTDYSFQFAKRFWNNRVSVIVGGRVSTGEEAKNSAGSFIDNVAIEYRLDRSATRYVKVFYDRSTQDPLEGQLTQTGAGLVLRRKTDKLGDLFIFSNRKKRDADNGSK